MSDTPPGHDGQMDPRITKLPKWAQDLIQHQARELEAFQARDAMMKLQHAEGRSDTFVRAGYGSVKLNDPVPIGQGARVRFVLDGSANVNGQGVDVAVANVGVRPQLEIRSYSMMTNQLVVLPQVTNTVLIETR